MEEYARSKGGVHNIIVTLRMVQLLVEAKKKNEERFENERKRKESSEKQVREADEKEKEKEEMLKKCAKFKESLEEAEQSHKKKRMSWMMI